jgi:tRNA dimethylallyltransferase
MAQIAVLVGPTACGKTAASIAVSKRLNAEIVSADSVQIYEKLDIGSAKPTPEEMDGVVHHMVGNVPLENALSVAQYQQMAFECIEDILGRGKLPLIVGGTGLYINALTTYMDFTQAGADQSFRDAKTREEQQEPGCLHRQLAQIDPPSAARLHPNDQKRIIRALEVFHLTGKTLTQSNLEDAAHPPRYQAVLAGLTMPRDMLYERIEKRVDLMFRQGLCQEVKKILEEGYDPELSSLQGLGYKELIAYFQGKCSLEQAMQIIKDDTRHFAKRQWTWFRRDQRIRWFDVSEYSFEELTGQLAAYYTQNINN